MDFLFPKRDKTQSMEAFEKFKGLFMPLEDVSDLGWQLLCSARLFRSHCWSCECSSTRVHFVHQTSLTKSLLPVKGKRREAALCPYDAEVSVVLSGVVVLQLLSWLPAG